MTNARLRALLWEHAHPTLRNMEYRRIAVLTEQILRIVTDRRLWTKWGKDREELAADIWIPMEDLREGLNALPGPQLTEVDVEQRIREFHEKPYGNGYLAKDVETEALAVFAEEKSESCAFVVEVLDVPHDRRASGGFSSPIRSRRSLSALWRNRSSAPQHHSSIWPTTMNSVPFFPFLPSVTCPLRSTGITPLHHYYGAVRPCPPHRYFRPRSSAACTFSLGIGG